MNFSYINIFEWNIIILPVLPAFIENRSHHMYASQDQSPLHMPSDQQSNSDQGFSQEAEPLHSFEELDIEIEKEIIQRFLPLSLLHFSINSIVVKSVPFKTLETRKLEELQEDELIAIKFTPLAIAQAGALKKINQKSGPNIINCVQAFPTAIIFPFYHGGLSSLIHRSVNMSSKVIKKLLGDCLKALLCLHEAGIVHGDIKPTNILYEQKNEEIVRFVLTDFAGSTSFSQIESLRCDVKSYEREDNNIFPRSWQYKAPQILSSSLPLSDKIDLWGVGCVLFECMTGEFLLPSETSPNTYSSMMKRFGSEKQILMRVQRFSFPTQIEQFKGLLICLLKQNPMERMGIDQFKKAVLQILG